MRCEILWVVTFSFFPGARLEPIALWTWPFGKTSVGTHWIKNQDRQIGSMEILHAVVSGYLIKTYQKSIRGSLGQIIGSDNALISLFSADDGHLLGKVRWVRLELTIRCTVLWCVMHIDDKLIDGMLVTLLVLHMTCTSWPLHKLYPVPPLPLFAFLERSFFTQIGFEIFVRWQFQAKAKATCRSWKSWATCCCSATLSWCETHKTRRKSVVFLFWLG